MVGQNRHPTALRFRCARRAQRMHATFYERFAEAFQLEAQAFVDAVLAICRAADLARRDGATRIGIALTQSLRTDSRWTLCSHPRRHATCVSKTISTEPRPFHINKGERP